MALSPISRAWPRPDVGFAIITAFLLPTLSLFTVQIPVTGTGLLFGRDVMKLLDSPVQKLYTRVSAAKETATVLRSEGHPWLIPRSSLALVTPNSRRFFVG
jgi:hypothetical protein